jgi:hypothetical protein
MQGARVDLLDSGTKVKSSGRTNAFLGISTCQDEVRHLP